MQQRLQKLLSRAGVTSRRKAEELIVGGQVSVNGRVVTELGAKADSVADVVRVGGKLIPPAPAEPVYLALNKPRGYISSTHDPEGRMTVMDLVGRYRSKVYPVGRLDYHTEGLLLLTNDGDFANQVLAAKSAVPKTYQAKASGPLSFEQMERFRQGGIRLDGRPTSPAQIRLRRAGPKPWYEVTLSEGRNRQVRRMFSEFGLQVEKLRRTRIGSLPLGELRTGEFRVLTAKEAAQLTRANIDDQREKRRPRKRPVAKTARSPRDPRKTGR